MLKDFLAYIKKQKLFLAKEKILLTVSGGLDSIVLEELFHRAGFNYQIAHCNFTLRAEESETDEVFVRDLAYRHGVQLFAKRFNTEAFAKGKGISIQMAARELRNKWFDQLLVEHDLKAYATAHHLNDSIETFIFNFTKGTGIAGLQGIRPKTGNIIRPLLFATRDMISAFAKEQSLSWREDSSNQSIKYHRNFIRHNVVPHLKNINPNLENTYRDTAERLRFANEIIEKRILQLKEDLLNHKDNELWIDIKQLQKTEAPVIVLFEIIKEYGFNYTQAGEIIDRLQGTSGRIFNSTTHQLNIDRNFIIVYELLDSEDIEYEFSEEDTICQTRSFTIIRKALDSKDFFKSKDASVILLDADKITYPLTIRKWRKGDRFIPLGMKGKKKLSDFMIDEKIPLNLKEHVFVLLTGSSIAWVINHRIDERFKVDDKTKSILMLKVEQHGQSI
jgi:tRNA(Ile)-lysidine synthase